MQRYAIEKKRFQSYLQTNNIPIESSVNVTSEMHYNKWNRDICEYRTSKARTSAAARNDAVTSLHSCTPDAAMGAPTFVPSPRTAASDVVVSPFRFHGNNDVVLFGPWISTSSSRPLNRFAFYRRRIASDRSFQRRIPLWEKMNFPRVVVDIFRVLPR